MNSFQVERFNQTLGAMLRKRVDDDGLSGHWDEDLPGCILAYNASKHSVTREYN